MDKEKLSKVTEEKISRDKAICEEVIELFRENGLTYAEGLRILSNTSERLQRMSERTQI